VSPITIRRVRPCLCKLGARAVIKVDLVRTAGLLTRQGWGPARRFGAMVAPKRPLAGSVVVVRSERAGVNIAVPADKIQEALARG